MNFVKKEIGELTGNPFNQIGKDWFLITSGTEESYNTMTASWGFMGVMWGAPSFICAVSLAAALEVLAKTITPPVGLSSRCTRPR